MPTDTRFLNSARYPLVRLQELMAVAQLGLLMGLISLWPASG